MELSISTINIHHYKIVSNKYHCSIVSKIMSLQIFQQYFSMIILLVLYFIAVMSVNLFSHSVNGRNVLAQHPPVAEFFLFLRNQNISDNSTSITGFVRNNFIKIFLCSSFLLHPAICLTVRVTVSLTVHVTVSIAVHVTISLMVYTHVSVLFRINVVYSAKPVSVDQTVVWF